MSQTPTNHGKPWNDRAPVRIVGHIGPELDLGAHSLSLTAGQTKVLMRDLRWHALVEFAGGFDAWMRQRTNAAHAAYMARHSTGGQAY